MPTMKTRYRTTLLNWGPTYAGRAVSPLPSVYPTFSAYGTFAWQLQNTIDKEDIPPARATMTAAAQVAYTLAPYFTKGKLYIQVYDNTAGAPIATVATYGGGPLSFSLLLVAWPSADREYILRLSRDNTATATISAVNLHGVQLFAYGE